jgi:hypothetical protein
MMESRKIIRANCSQKLIAISEMLVEMNKEMLYDKLKKRGVG